MCTKQREQIRQKPDGELLKIKATRNDYWSDLAREELEHRGSDRNVLPDRRRSSIALVVSILALIVAIIALCQDAGFFKLPSLESRHAEESHFAMLLIKSLAV